eukprot:g74488.t1
MHPKKKPEEAPATPPKEPVEPLDEEAGEEEDEEMEEMNEEFEAFDLEDEKKKVRKRGGRKPRTPNVVVEGQTYYADIDTAAGIATVYREAKECRVECQLLKRKSVARVKEYYVVKYSSGRYYLFQKHANIGPITNKKKLGKIVTIYSVKPGKD